MGLHAPPEPDDGELLRRAKAGELAAFEALTSRLERRVYSLALRRLHHEQDPEVVTQQTFLSALEHLESFREESGFCNWLLRIASQSAPLFQGQRRGEILGPFVLKKT